MIFHHFFHIVFLTQNFGVAKYTELALSELVPEKFLLKIQKKKQIFDIKQGTVKLRYYKFCY
jgi:hypothetical protein